MRESRQFAERTRTLASDEAVKKYYLIYEGSNTEALYFSAVNNRRDDIGINPLIELIPVVRSYSEEGWSNPKKILDRVIKNLEENVQGKLSYETLLNRIMDYFDEQRVMAMSKMESKSLWNTMVEICKEKYHSSLHEEIKDIEETCNTILELLQEKYEITNIISDISDIIKTGEITYAEGFDKICLIVDRDRKSFLSTTDNNQYAYVYNKCKENDFGFYITNPCFEFWLLLHFDEVFELDRDKMLENPKVTSKRRYVERELRRIFPGYKKSFYNAEKLVKYIDKAIENEKSFCEEAEDLENQLGSNIGKLIYEMKNTV